MKAKREQWIIDSKLLDARRLVFLDETGAKTNMTRRYGRSPVGERVRDCAPAGHWSTTTLIAAMREDGPMAPLLLDGGNRRRGLHHLGGATPCTLAKTGRHRHPGQPFQPQGSRR